MDGTTYLKAIACLFAWRETKGRSVNEMLAVLFALRKRTQLEGWGDWHEIIRNHSVVMSLLDNKYAIEYPDPRDPKLLQLLDVFESVYSGEALDRLTDGGIYWIDISNPVFTKQPLERLNKLERVAQVGQLYFYTGSNNEIPQQ